MKDLNSPRWIAHMFWVSLTKCGCAGFIYVGGGQEGPWWYEAWSSIGFMDFAPWIESVNLTPPAKWCMMMMGHESQCACIPICRHRLSSRGPYFPGIIVRLDVELRCIESTGGTVRNHVAHGIGWFMHIWQVLVVPARVVWEHLQLRGHKI